MRQLLVLSTFLILREADLYMHSSRNELIKKLNLSQLVFQIAIGLQARAVPDCLYA